MEARCLCLSISELCSDRQGGQSLVWELKSFLAGTVSEGGDAKGGSRWSMYLSEYLTCPGSASYFTRASLYALQVYWGLQSTSVQGHLGKTPPLVQAGVVKLLNSHALVGANQNTFVSITVEVLKKNILQKALVLIIFIALCVFHSLISRVQES